MEKKSYCNVNTLLQGRYVVGLAMGNNELGITYHGHDNVTNKKVAIKEYFPNGIATRENNMVSGTESFATGLQKFVKEANILKEKSGLVSIVAVLDVVQENGTAYVVMEYVEGTSLEEVIRGNRVFPIKRILDLMEPFLKCLFAVHEAGVIHQNISPDNIIFTNDGYLKLIGFGCLEGVVSEKSKGYAPIELYRKQEEKRPSTDIYALCATIYRCITGKIPVDAMERLNKDELELPSSMGIEISELQEAVISMGMSVSSDKRLQGVQALYRALYGIVMNSDIQENISTTPVKEEVKEESLAKKVTEPEVKEAPESEKVAESEVKQAPESEKVTELEVKETPKPEKETESEVKEASVTINPVEPQVYESPQPVQTQQPAQMNVKKSGKQEKKKGTKKGLIIGICVALVLLLVVIGGALVAFGLYSGKISTKLLVNTVNVETSETSEVVTEEEDAEGKVDKLQEIKDTLAKKDYLGAIDMVTALSEEEKATCDEAEIASVSKEAVEGVKSSLITEIDAYVNAAEYDEAFAAITDGISYFGILGEKEVLAGLIDDQFLKDKEKEIQQKHKDYLNTTAESCANKADEEGMEAALTGLASYLETEALEAKKTKCYGKLVVAKMTQMRNSGSSTEEILAYIKENLAKTGNNCWVLEFWDYYNTVYAMESGKGITTDTTIKNVSKEGYLLEYSNSKNLTKEDIKQLSEYELYLALYEIYARHGRGFNDASVTSYFSKYDWYEETTRPEVFDESILNEYEKYNRDLIIEYQYEKGYR